MTKTIKNLAEFKRAITVGQLMHTQHAKLGDFGIRPISLVNTKTFALKTEQKHFAELKKVPTNTDTVHVIDTDIRFLDFREAKFIISQKGWDMDKYPICKVTNGKESVYVTIETKTIDSFCEFPNASNIECNGTNTVKIFWGTGAARELILTYTFID